MNTVNPDLKFTAETVSDFENSRLPTLDFELWLDTYGKIQHHYFKKPMKSEFVIMKSSAMSQKQKIAILSN